MYGDHACPAYPPTRRAPVVDHYHGVAMTDCYRHLEAMEAPETQEWLTAQGAYTTDLLRALPAHAPILARLRVLSHGPQYAVPFKVGSGYCSWITNLDGGATVQDQPILYRQDALDEPPVPVLDLNTLAPDGAASVNYLEASADGRVLAYAVSYHGSDWQTVRIRDLQSGLDYPERIEHCKFVGVAWAPDSSGFFYSRYPAPDEVPDLDRHNYCRVFWHRLGTPQRADPLVACNLDDKSTNLYPIATADGRYLLLHLWDNGNPHGRLLYRRMESAGPFLPLLPHGDAHYNFVDSHGDSFLIQTDCDAPNGRIIAVDPARPGREHWRTVVPETDDAIAFSSMVLDLLLVVYLHHACHRAMLYRLDGTIARELPLPPICAVTGLWGRAGEPELFVSLESPRQPPAIYRYDARTYEFTVLRASPVPFDAAPYETRQVWYAARDGTRIPMFLTHRKGLRLDGTNPVVLNGYGGFGTSVPPLFYLSMVPLLEAGGIFAVANIRGGGEYGATWHQAAVRERKQTSFDDFADAAEWLITERYTSASRLAIIGASNGGLLVATCLVQRPDLYGAAVSEVPITDMLRYQRFTVGQHLTAEYGNAEASAGEFATLAAYSPLHNVRDGVAYPAMLVTTSDNDDRAVPLHAMKFVAALQTADPHGAPHLLRVERGAGHGMGKSTTRLIAEMADVLTFLFTALGIASDCRQGGEQLPGSPAATERAAAGAEA